MELKEIKQIVELMNMHELSYFHLEKDDFCLELKKGADVTAIKELITQAAPAQPVLSAQQPAALPATAASPAGAAHETGLQPGEATINAPMVGTFYRASTPDKPPFVTMGQEVEEDTTICVIEAMKTFNEIKAERRGTIVKVLVDNAQPVQYDDPLFIIQPA